MPKLTRSIRRKWWFRWIRALNYFAFRFWWLIWLLFILTILALLIFCPCINREKDSHMTEMSSAIDRIAGKMNQCCNCDSVRIEEAVECPNRELVFQICNENMDIDDNFEVLLNGMSIGNIDLNSNQQVGSVFIASKNANLTIGEADFTCPMGNMKIFYFDPTILRYGENRIELKNIKNNGNNNKGTIGIRNYLNVSNVLREPCIVEDLTFRFESGRNFGMSFNYTKCCE